jgi:curved DNA-binding protein CbpA
VPTHYDVLGVDPEASPEEIQRAYRLLALRHHPDVAPEADRSAMASINGAWEVLGDPDRRRSYDASIRAPETSPAPEAPPAPDWEPLSDDDDDIDPEDLSDEPYAPMERKPADMLVMTPVLLILVAVAVFFFSIMSGSEALRTFSILLVPVSAVGFVMAPLFVMLRSKSRSTE